MINILYEKLPQDIVIDNKSYPIVTDFRNWIAFFDMLSDDTLTPTNVVISALDWFTDTIPKDINLAYEGLISFARCDDLQYKQNQSNSNGSIKQTLSYLYDSEYIFGAFLQAYNINLRNVEYLHWYEFNALFSALPEDTPIKKRMAYRSINVSSIKDKQERKRIISIKREIAFPKKKLSAEQFGNLFS